MKKIIITISALTASIMLMAVGGIIAADVAADTEEPEIAAVEEIQEEPEASEEITEEPEEVETTTEEPEEEPAAEAATTPAEIIAAETGLTVDSVKQFDSYGNWSAYEVFADGDIYAVTIKADHVDVVQILN